MKAKEKAEKLKAKEKSKAAESKSKTAQTMVDYSD